MPICKKCGNHFPNRKVIDGKLRALNKRSNCLDCSPFDAECRKPYLQRKGVDVSSGKRVCIQCSKPYNYKDTNKRRVCNSCRINKGRRVNFSRKCAEYKGGKCLVCGYSKCLRALHFHHLIPSEKLFGIAGSHCRGWATNCKEMDKCVLICSNCHSEVHDGLITTEELIELESRRKGIQTLIKQL